MTEWTGKGSRPRPRTIDEDQYASNWDRIFSKKKEQPSEEDTKDTDKEETKDTN
jgi:hypothetical protein